MTEESTKPKKPKPPRYTLAPLYLAAGLAVCYLVLTQMVPAMHAVTDDGPIQRPPVEGWPGVSLAISGWVRTHPTTTITAFAIVAVAGFALPFLIRPAKYLVWLAALAVFLLDVALAAGGYWQMIMSLLSETDKVAR